jgi:hypothetical protein
VLIEPSLTCATIGGVAACVIRGGEGGRGQAWARRRNHPEAELSGGRDGDCARGQTQRRARRRFASEGRFCFSCRIRCPIGWQAACVYSIWGVIMLLCPDMPAVLFIHCAPVPLRGVGVHIKCEFSPPGFMRLCPICMGSARARRTGRW